METAADKQVADDTSKQPSEAPKGAFWGVFFSTFITIFLAELGDKTQVATLLLSAESQSPFVVFLGAGLALVSTSLIGVLLGQWMSTRVSEDTLDTCAGILLLLITIGLVGDIVGQ
ncbi:MAG: TMEM165/GDT1 family protein [Cyanobacteria bacterium J06634_5]